MGTAENSGKLPGVHTTLEHFVRIGKDLARRTSHVSHLLPTELASNASRGCVLQWKGRTASTEEGDTPPQERSGMRSLRFVNPK
jgi:hypothetical protein